MKLASENLGTNHPEYRSMESELAELRTRLAQETKLLATSFSTSRMISTDKEKELKAAIEAQKKRVLELRTERDRLAVLQRDVESVRAAYDAVARRHTMTNLESQATQANVSLLTAATPPLHPNRRADRYILLAVLLSAMLGLGAGVGLEILDRRVRTVDDVAGMLQLPVLAVIGRRKSLLQLGWRRQSSSVALR
jgi:uncharacterized protein involved in exopolysaccharide biosynthesis